MKTNKPQKAIPVIMNDDDAEDFIANSDLTNFDLSGFKPVSFELTPKDESIHLRLPASLLQTIKTAAAKQNIPYSRLIRLTLEQALKAS